MLAAYISSHELLMLKPLVQQVDDSVDSRSKLLALFNVRFAVEPRPVQLSLGYFLGLDLGQTYGLNSSSSSSWLATASKEVSSIEAASSNFAIATTSFGSGSSEADKSLLP